MEAQPLYRLIWRQGVAQRTILSGARLAANGMSALWSEGSWGAENQLAYGLEVELVIPSIPTIWSIWGGFVGRGSI